MFDIHEGANFHNAAYRCYPNLRDEKVDGTRPKVVKDPDVLMLLRKSDLDAIENDGLTAENLQALFDNAQAYPRNDEGGYTGFSYDPYGSGGEWTDVGYYYRWSHPLLSNWNRENEEYWAGIIITNNTTGTGEEYVIEFVDRLYFQNADDASDIITTCDLQLYGWESLSLISDVESETIYDYYSYSSRTLYNSFTKDNTSYVPQTIEVPNQLFRLYRFSGDDPKNVREIYEALENGEYETEWVALDVIFAECMYEGETWVDLWNPVVSLTQIESHFNENHNTETDHNVIIGLPDRYPIFPYWAASPYPWVDAAHDDENHPDVTDRFDGDASDPLNFKYAEYGRMGNGDKFVTIREAESGAKTLDADIHYVNFGVSKGYFVQVKSKPGDASTKTNWTQPNRAYFSVSRAHMPHVFSNGNGDAKIALFLISDDKEVTGIKDASHYDSGKMMDDNWYTLDGRRLTSQPTKKGIYIRKGRKEIVK